MFTSKFKIANHQSQIHHSASRIPLYVFILECINRVNAVLNYATTRSLHSIIHILCCSLRLCGEILHSAFRILFAPLRLSGFFNHPITKSAISNPSVPFRRIVMRPLQHLFTFSPLCLLAFLFLAPGCGGSKSFTPTAPAGTVTGYIFTRVTTLSRLSPRIADISTPTGYMPLVGASVTCVNLPPVTTNTSGYFSISNVPTGQQNCSATKTGYDTQNFTVNVLPGKTVEPSAPLEIKSSKTGKLSLTSSPKGATVVIDASITAVVTDTVLNQLVVGSHSINIILNGYEDSTAQTVNIVENATSTLQFLLAKKVISIAISTEISPAPSALAPGDILQLKATCTYADSTTATCTNDVTWTSLDTNVADISSLGLLTAKKPGTVTISATRTPSGVSKTAEFIIACTQGKYWTGTTCAQDTLTKITITSPSTSVLINQNLQLTATCTYTSGSTSNCTSFVTWAIDPTSSIASIGTSTGLLTGKAQGQATVSATLSSITSAILSITVTSASVTSITISPATPPQIAIGVSQQFSATCQYSDGTQGTCTTGVLWNSSASNVGIIGSSTGLFTAKGAGDTVISASSGTVTSINSATINVIRQVESCVAETTDFCIDIVDPTSAVTTNTDVSLEVRIYNIPTNGVSGGMTKITWDSNLEHVSHTRGTNVNYSQTEVLSSTSYSAMLTISPSLQQSQAGYTLLTLVLRPKSGTSASISFTTTGTAPTAFTDGTTNANEITPLKTKGAIIDIK